MSKSDKDSIYRSDCSKITLQSKKEGFFNALAETLSQNIDINIFSKCTTDLERVKLVTSTSWNLIAAELLYRGKKPEDAISRRVLGNKYFEKGDYNKALIYYSQSIIQAPVGPELVSVYSNRSALLQKMGEYQLAITDAELAISYESPENTRHKLYERMASCHYSLKNYHKSKVILRLAKHFGEKYDKDNAKFAKKLEKISTSIEKATQGSKPFDSKPEPEKPVSNFKPGKKYSSASEKFDVRFSPGVGRYAFAKQKINTGEEILREKPYASYLSTDKMGTYCLHCFVRLKAPVACDNCAHAAFCSVQCKKDAECYHKYECRIMALLLGSGMSLNVYLAMRIITQSSEEAFKQILPDLHSNPENVPITRDGKFDPLSYSSIYNLGALEDQRDPQDFLERTIMAVFIMKCLRLVGYFEINLFKNPLPTDAELQIGALILRNLQVLQFNAYEVCEFIMETKFNYKKSNTNSLGIAIFPTASYFNHSCAPDVTRYFIGTTMVIKAINGVEDNAAISDNYGPNFGKLERDDRRYKMLGRYWFHCTCDACLNDWPMLRACLQEIEPKTPEESKALKKLQQLETLYFDSAMKAMEAGKPLVAIELFKKFIQESEMILQNHKSSEFYPYKTVLLCQEGLKLCYCSLGSVFITNK